MRRATSLAFLLLLIPARASADCCASLANLWHPATNSSYICGGQSPDADLTIYPTCSATKTNSIVKIDSPESIITGKLRVGDSTEPSLASVEATGSIGFLYDDDTTGGTTAFQVYDGTETISNIKSIVSIGNGTYTFNNIVSALYGFRIAGTFSYTTAPLIGSGIFYFGPTLDIQTTGSSSYYTAFAAIPTFSANGVAAALSTSSNSDFQSGPTFTTAAGGSYSASSARKGYTSGVTVSAGTINSFTGYDCTDKTGAGTLTTHICMDIPAMSGATTPIGLRNADTTVYTSGATQTLAAAGNTISASATFVEIDNSTGASLTITSTPTIADGQDGQYLILVNVDSADDIVLRDQSAIASNLRNPGGANLTLGPRDSVTYLFSSALGDWIAIATSNN